MKRIKTWHHSVRCNQFCGGIALVGWIALASALHAWLTLRAPFSAMRPINSDSLFAAHRAWAILQDTRATLSFPLSRVLSPFDMAYAYIVEWAGLGWRVGQIFYGPLVLFGLALALTRLVTRLNGVPFLDAAIRSAALLGAVMAATAASDVIEHASGWSWLFMVFAPVYHGNGFLLALLAMAVPIDQPRRIAGLCFLAVLSDAQAIGVFLLPFLLSTYLTRDALSPRWREVMLWSIAAAFLGLLLLSFLPISGADGATFQDYLARLRMSHHNFQPFLADLAHHPWFLVPVGGSAWLAMAAWHARRDAPQRDATRILVMCALSAWGSLLLTLLVYEGPQSWRYAHAAVWLPFLLLIPKLRRPNPLLSWAALIAGAFGFWTAAETFHHDRDPLARCLSHQLGLRAGMANYWYARSTAAATDWQHHITPIGPNGRGWRVNTDYTLNRVDPRHRDRPAQFNFILMQELEPARIVRAYGPPARIVTCPGSTIWVYETWLHVLS